MTRVVSLFPPTGRPTGSEGGLAARRLRLRRRSSWLAVKGEGGWCWRRMPPPSRRPSRRHAGDQGTGLRSRPYRSGRRSGSRRRSARPSRPLGEGVWLATELDEDGDTLFGLADLGEPEFGSFSLAEMTAVRLPLGLGIERDILFEGLFPISVWAETAHRTGSIRDAERVLHAIRRAGREDV